MFIKKLTLEKFRNIDYLTFIPHNKINLLIGDNGSGKTNIVEGLGCLSTTKSFRGKKDSYLVKLNETYYRLIAEVVDEESDFTLEVCYDGSQKITKMNGVKKPKLIDFIGNLKVVIFTPKELELIQQGSAERRRYIDVLLCQVSRSYGRKLLDYNKILKQRNAILKEHKNRDKHLNDLLDTYDESLSHYVAYIWSKRLKTLDMLKEHTISFFNEINNGEDKVITMEYESECKNLAYDMSIEELRQIYLSHMKRQRGADLVARTTTLGVHRDDIKILLNGVDSRVYASQGQQRLMALALIMAQVSFIEEVSKISPILILDDVFGEFDQKKIDNIFNFLNQGTRQCFITNANILDINQPHHLFNVSNGTIL